MLFSLLLGTAFLPFNVYAGLISSLLGTEAEADVVESITSATPTKNSQTLALLQADVSSAFILDGKKDVSTEEGDDLTYVNIVSDNALYPTVSRIMGGIDDLGSYSDQISVYVVRKGDSISQIANMYDVSVNTILWGNDLRRNAVIKEGDILFILPISGVEHTVAKGETLKTIAKKYKADVVDIVRFNGITEETKLSIGDKLIIPGGGIYNESTSSSSSSGSTKNVPSYSGSGSISNYFINPVPGLKRRSQNSHGPGNRGVDLAAPTGTPVYASASGKVYFARTGWNGAYGNLVIIDHPNGTRTLYAHLSKIQTTTGAWVKQGEQIGTVGSTGRSTGPHLHFEVFKAKNPGTDWSWKPFW